MAMDEVLTAGEMAWMTGVPVSTLDDWAANGSEAWSRPVPQVVVSAPALDAR
jgi:hypothetical protein